MFETVAAFAVGIIMLCLLAKLAIIPAKLLWKLLTNSIVGAVMLWVIHMAGTITAFDIGESAVKIVTVSGENVKKAVCLELPDNLVSDGMVVFNDAMAETLRTAMSKGGISKGICCPPPLASPSTFLPFRSPNHWCGTNFVGVRSTSHSPASAFS